MPMTFIVRKGVSTITVMFFMCHLYGLTQALMFIRIFLFLSREFTMLNSLVRSCWFRLKHPPGGEYEVSYKYPTALFWQIGLKEDPSDSTPKIYLTPFRQ
ncbi:hypothetical protein J6590_075892 [Homalodisca vitripennis]|nr:hypothetical protein J6590_075892 [Homalodisca vitripennis]